MTQPARLDYIAALAAFLERPEWYVRAKLQAAERRLAEPAEQVVP